jgi:Bacterial PH domain
MIFRSKRGIFSTILLWGLGILLLVAVPGRIYMEAGTFDSRFFTALIICTPFSLFAILGWFGTYYVVTDTEVELYGAFIRVGKVPIASIKSIACTHNPTSAPALTFRRLEIMYGKWDMALVSPENEKDFLQVLKEKNPHIVLDEKLR